MQIAYITTEFPFIEYALSLDRNKASGHLSPDYHIDEKRLNKLLNSSLKFPLWIDFSEIALDTNVYPGQLDLLGHSDEPAILLESADKESVYLFKCRKHETYEDMFYGRDQKYLIEKCLIIWLTNSVKPDVNENDNFEKYFQICKNQVVKIDYLNNELMNVNLELEKFFTSLFSYFLKDEMQEGTKISLSDSTLEYLLSSKIEFSELESMAKEAYKTALELSPSSTDIRIRRYFLPEPSSNKLNKTVIPEIIPEILKPLEEQKPQKITKLMSAPKPSYSKLEKTIQLLDRYELAVEKLVEARLPVMGKNIADACIPKISAPALTDSINKHKARIADCLKTYPDKWPLLRSNYIPVQKLFL